VVVWPALVHQAHAGASKILADRIHLGRAFRKTRFTPAPHPGVNSSLGWVFNEVDSTSDRSVCDLALVHRYRLASVRQEIRQRSLDIFLRLTSAGIRGASGEFFAFTIAPVWVFVNVVLTDIGSPTTVVAVRPGESRSF
jgi:hypothetical protein